MGDKVVKEVSIRVSAQDATGNVLSAANAQLDQLAKPRNADLSSRQQVILAQHREQELQAQAASDLRRRGLLPKEGIGAETHELAESLGPTRGLRHILE